MKYRTVGIQLDQAAMKYQRAHPEVSYSQALEAAMVDNPELTKEYVAEFAHLSRRHVKQHGLEDAEDEDSSTIAAEKEIDRLVQAWLREHPTEKDNYSKGLQIVLARHPDLKLRWTKNYNPEVRKFSSKEFEHVVTVEYDEKSASAEVDALVKKLHKENPDWTIGECLREARARLKKKGEKIADVSAEMEIAQNALHAALERV